MSMTIVYPRVSVDFVLRVFLARVSRGYNNGPATVCVHYPPTLGVQDPGNMGVNNPGNMGVNDPGNMGVHNSGSMGVHDTGTMGVQSGGKSSVDTISVEQHCGQILTVLSEHCLTSKSPGSEMNQRSAEGRVSTATVCVLSLAPLFPHCLRCHDLKVF